MRTYKKRTKSTKSKTYKDYLEMRKELLAKGYQLEEVMSEVQFEKAYELLKSAKEKGEIKSSPWAALKRKERYVKYLSQAKILAKGASKLYDRNVTIQEIYKMTPAEIHEIGEYVNDTKKDGIYGGSYE